MANMIIDSNPLADYVVAKGTSAKWRYIKYANGFAMCWCTWTETNSHYSSNGPSTMPYAHYITFTLPFSFYEPPSVVAMSRVGNGFSHTFYASESDSTTTTAKVNFCGSASSDSCGVRVMVQGLWKALS